MRDPRDPKKQMARERGRGKAEVHLVVGVGGEGVAGDGKEKEQGGKHPDAGGDGSGWAEGDAGLGGDGEHSRTNFFICEEFTIK